MGPGTRRTSDNDVRNLLASSFRSGSPLAQQALAEDIAACSDDDEDLDSHIANENAAPGHIMYRRPSGVAFGASRPVFSDRILDEPALTSVERQQSRNAERSLLRDNHILPPKRRGHSQQPGLASRIYHHLFSTKVPQQTSGGDENGDASAQGPSETSPLLQSAGSVNSIDDVEEQWEEAIASRKLTTTWQRETKTMAVYSAPLIVTFFLQYSINVVAVLAVGRIGKMELGAVSLANMTAAITCLAPFQGLSTSLDTLCAQAYGSGHKHLVGVQFQRMTFFLFSLWIPVAIIWFFSEGILNLVVPNPESARLASQYLRVMIFGIPGFILFEGGKRFIQAQGLFAATTYVLLIASPLHVLLTWLLVYKFELGFIGAPIAVAFTDNFMAVLLFLYVKYVDGSQCWGGFSKRAFKNWWIMIKLALPGMIMVEAEWLAFEILTLVSSRFGVEYLAAQSVITTLGAVSYQIPFAMSIGSSTRVANLVGAGLVDAAKIAAKVTFVIALFLGIFNQVIYTALRYHLPLLFTDDAEVIEICAKVLPVVAVLQVFDSLSAGAHGLLRGIGKQAIGGPANLIAYYVISLPISLGLALGLDWKLQGLWGGVIVGLASVSAIEYIYLLVTDWETAAREAETRNAAG